MTVRLTVPAALQRFVDDVEQLTSSEVTVAAALQDICRRHPQLAERLVDSGWELRGHLVAAIDGSVLSSDAHTDRVLDDGTVVQILFLASGG